MRRDSTQHKMSIMKLPEFFYYVIIGGIVTVIDWTLFAIAINQLGLHYQTALILAFLSASAVHYTANKLITFRCASKAIASQLSVFFIVLGISLTCNMLIMATLVNLFSINKVFLRMATTILMLVPNYLFHKNMTFNKRLFAEPQSL